MDSQATKGGKTAKPAAAQDRWLYFPRPVAWVVLGISLAASVGGWLISSKHADLEARKNFEGVVGRIAMALKERMLIYEDVLHGAAGLFAASYSVERAEWQAYVQSVSIEQRFPGIDSVGFAARVSPAQLDGFLSRTRADNAPGFQVRDGDGPHTNDLILVKYLDPEVRHAGTLGWNMAGDPVRRAAAEQAARTGRAALSGTILISTEAAPPRQGCLLLLPVYRHNAPNGTDAEREVAVEGWVFARFIIDELMEQVLGTDRSRLHLQVLDTTASSKEAVVFDSDPTGTPQQAGKAIPLRTTLPVRVGGRDWSLSFTALPRFAEDAPRRNTFLVGAGGGLISLLLFGIAWSLSHTRERALAMAQRRTSALREINERLEQEVRERQRSEAALKHSEAAYHSLVDSLPLSIIRRDLEGHILFVNQRFCKRFGTSLDVLRERGDAHLFPPEVAARRAQADQEVIRTGRTVEQIEERPQPDGSTHYVQAIRTPLRDDDGKLTGILGIFWDVTDKQRAEADLQHERFLLRTLMDNLPDRIYFKDLQSRFLRNSRAHLKRLGVEDPQAAMGKSDFDFFSEESARRTYQDEQEVVRSGQPINKEERTTSAGGVETWALITKMPLRDEQGTIVGTFGISRDITDRVRAEKALRESEARFQLMASTIEDVLYGVSGATGEFDYVNPAFERLLGYTLADVAAMGGREKFLAQVIQRGQFDEQKHLFEEMHSHGPVQTAHRTESWWRCKDGKLRCFEDCWIPLFSGHTLTGTYGVLRDITDRKQAEEAMREAKDAAEEASRAKSQFLASMSHELRTPLNSVIGFANILLKNKAGNLVATELNFLERILANGKHLLALINEILDLSKIEARKVEVQLKPVALDALVRETVAQQEGLVRDRSIRLLADVPSQVVPIEADPDKLKQILINLMGNALKFTEQGSVTVRLVTDPDTHLPQCLEVIDTGIGIPQDKLKVIFEAFQQAEVGTARKYGGTGLGLTISQALCQLMGYRIEVSSEVGRGSTFRILLTSGRRETPTTIRARATAAPPTRPDPSTDLKGRLVLVIDDELDSRTLLTHMIEDFGCRAVAASSGAQGLQMAREFRPDVITVDLMMPQMDGWQVIRALKDAPDLRDIPVVVVSIVAGENRGGILGAIDVLQKPVSREDLLAALRRSLAAPNPSILIVDDEEDSRRLLAEHLEDEPCQLQMAANGEEALRLMQQFTPDLILLDLMMPVMDGMTFLKEIRAKPRFQWVPVVVVTCRELSAAELDQLKHTTQEIVKKGDVFEADLKGILHRLLRARPPHPSTPGP